MSDPKAWGNRFREFYAPKYKSLDDLADALADFGIVKDATLLSHWQNGRRIPTKLEDHLDLVRAFAALDLIKDSTQANEWLGLAGFRNLKPEEIEAFFPGQSVEPEPPQPRKPLHQLEPLLPHHTAIQNFRRFYLGGPGQPVPFGGRDQALADLHQWLADPTRPPYRLLAAPAGRGKSALLVRWSQELLEQERNNLTVIFIPISIRFQTNLSGAIFSALTARLAAYHGEDLPKNIHSTTEDWRGWAADYLARPLSEGEQLLFILDGLDEAADWQAGPGLFPTAPPEGLRVVLSARCTAYAPDGYAWLERLGWPATLAEAPLLDPLDRAGVVDALVKMGAPLDQLGARVDIVGELHRLSEGDPLLVSLYVDDLWRKGAQATRLEPEDLRQIKPGYGGYFEKWWEDQQKIWGERRIFREEVTNEVLDILACALGPLTTQDILRLARPEVGLKGRIFKGVIQDLARFVIGEGEENQRRYSFNHPKLGDYFYGDLPQEE